MLSHDKKTATSDQVIINIKSSHGLSRRNTIESLNKTEKMTKWQTWCLIAGYTIIQLIILLPNTLIIQSSYSQIIIAEKYHLIAINTRINILRYISALFQLCQVEDKYGR